MISSQSHIDISRLERVRRSGEKTVARCPACAEGGGDRRGGHLVILPNGKFACAAYPGDSEHRRRIFALAGVAGERDPARERQWREKRAAERQTALRDQCLAATAREKRAAIIARHPWDSADVWDDSPQRIDSPLVEHDPRHFLASLFSPDALLWTGNVYETGQYGRHSDRWRSCAGWQALPSEARVGPMTTPAIWQPGTISRSAGQVLSAPYTVLDFDGIDGLKPETPELLRKHLADCLALIRWFREGLSWQLAAIVWTGGKSLHAWFRSLGKEALESLGAAALPFGLDSGLIGRPEHPCRLPGHPHAKTGERSRVLWLQLPPL